MEAWRILWWTTDSASDSPSGPTKPADILPEYAGCANASSGSLTRLALHTVSCIQEKLTHFDGRTRQLMEPYRPCRNGPNGVVSALQNWHLGGKI